MITNDSFHGLVFERDRVQTLLDNCPEYVLSAILAYIIDRRFCGWNKSDACFRVSPFDTNADLLFEFFQKGRISFDDLLAAYNWVTYSSINPKYESYYVPAGTLVEDDTPALTDDFEEEKKVELNNPRWEHVDRERKNESADSVAPGDTITLMVDCLNLVNGASVEFTLYDTSGNKPRKVASVKGKHSGGLAKVEWLVDNSQCTPETTYSFDAKTKDAISTRCPVDLLLPDSLVVRLHIDPSATESKDDTVVLFTDDESQKIIKTVKDDKVPGDAFLDLVFSGIKKDKKYSLVVDPGKEGVPYFVFENVEGKVLLSDDEIDYSEE